MRPYLAAMIVPLLAGAALAEPLPSPAEPASTAATPSAQLPPPGSPSPGAAEMAGRVIDPDTNCRHAALLAQGADGEAQLRREPARPTPPPLIRAVDYEIDGCDMILTSAGEVRPLPATSIDPRLRPAQ